jgi:hypothetical protein
MILNFWVDEMIANETRVLVTFSVYSDNLSVTDITDVLALEADQAISKGDSIGESALKAKRTRWTIEEVGYDLNGAEDVVVKIISRLNSITDKLHVLANESEFLLSICLSWYSGDPSPGVRLDVKSLGFLYKNNITAEIITELYPGEQN